MTIPKTIPSFFGYFIKCQSIAFFIVFLTSLTWSVNDVLFPYFIKLFINIINSFKGNPNNIYSILSWPIFALITCWVVMTIAMRVQGFVLAATFPRFRANIRETVFDYVKQHSHEYFSSNFAGSIAQKLASLPTSCQTVLEILIFNLSSITVGFIIAVVLVWRTHVIFAEILIAWFCLHMGTTVLFLRIGNKRWEIHSEAVATLTGKVVDCFTNIMNVRLFARSHYENTYLRRAQADEIKKAKKALFLMEIMYVLQGIFGLGLIFAVLFTLIHGWVQGWVTIGDFSLVGMLAFWVLGMVWYMSYQLSVLVREIGTIGQSLSLVTLGHDILDKPHAAVLKVNQGDIRFVDVSFHYRKNHAVFHKLNVHIPAGQKVGLVGFSGAGKSTFVNLMLRFYDLNGGSILIDRQDIAEVTQDSLHEQIAMIPQDPTLFHRTLMENIRYGRLNASDEEVIAAAKLAHCHEFIEKLSDGYQALVGERGIKLSGGQRQRVAIARAILKNAPILILDEATSSLDSVTEKVIQESLQQLMRGKTTIVVAHRLSTLASMDRVLVFHQGKIIEDGTREELLAMNGHFAKLWNMQTDGFLPDK